MQEGIALNRAGHDYATNPGRRFAVVTASLCRWAGVLKPFRQRTLRFNTTCTASLIAILPKNQPLRDWARLHFRVRKLSGIVLVEVGWRFRLSFVEQKATIPKAKTWNCLRPFIPSFIPTL